MNWRNWGMVLWSLHLRRIGRVHSSLVLLVRSVNWRKRGMVLWSLHLRRIGRVHSSLVLLVHSISSCHMCWWVASQWRKTMLDLRFSWQWLWRMLSFGILCHVALVRTYVLPPFKPQILQDNDTLDLITPGNLLITHANYLLLKKFSKPWT
jgi:hypothetical protein